MNDSDAPNVTSSSRGALRPFLRVLVLTACFWYLGGTGLVCARSVSPDFNVHSSVLLIFVYWPPLFVAIAGDLALIIYVVLEIPIFSVLACSLRLRARDAIILILVLMASLRVPNLMVEESMRYGWLYIPIVAIGGASLLITIKRVRSDKREIEGRCKKCGYDLRGLSESRCPECGVEFTRAG